METENDLIREQLQALQNERSALKQQLEEAQAQKVAEE